MPSIPAASSASTPHVHPSRRTAVFGSPRNPSSSQKRKRDTSDDGISHSDSNPLSSKRRGLSSQVRSLGRLLNYAGSADMRPDVRLEKERELATKKAELEEAQMKRERGIMVGRYHMVRFFERKRATRVLKRAKKEIEALRTENRGMGNEEQIRRAEKRVHDAEVDLNYTQFAPLMEKYKSLYPKSERTAKGEKSKKPEKDDEDEESVTNEEVNHNNGSASLADEPTVAEEEHASASARYGTTWRLIEAATQSGDEGALERVREWRPTVNQGETVRDDGKESHDTFRANPGKSRNGKTREQRQKGGATKKIKVEGSTDQGPIEEASGRTRGGRRGKREQEVMNEDENSNSDGGFFEE